MTEGFQGPFQNHISKGDSFMSTNEKGTPQSRTYTVNDIAAILGIGRASATKAATMECLSENPPYSPNFMLPLFSSIYADGQQMVTFTGIVLDSHEKEAKIKEALKNYPHNTFSWDTPSKIEIPALSVREITELNKLLPNPDIRQQLIECFPFIFSEKDGQAVDSYISYYKYYPNYHQVSF